MVYSVLMGLMIFVFLAGAIAAIKIVPLIKMQNCADGSLFSRLQEAADTSILTICYSCDCYI